jgi:hypothetical protein
MHKVLFVALLTACMVNVACLCGHLSLHAGARDAPRASIAGPGPIRTIPKSLL